jgi:hypothetical protein
LENLKNLDKAAIGRKLAQVNNDIRAMSAKLNKSISVPLLLCLEDAMQNIQIDVERQYQQNQPGNIKMPKEVYLLTSMFFARFFGELDDTLSSISANGFSAPSKVGSLPELISGFYTDQTLDDYLEELVSQGKLEAVDKKRNFLYDLKLSHSLFEGGLVIILRDATRKQEEVMKKILRLRDLYGKKSLFEEMLGLPDGYRVEWGEDGFLKRAVPTEGEIESLEKQIDSDLRSLETDTYVPDWNSAFRKVEAETLRLTPKKGKANFALIEKGSREFFRGYKTIEGYSETFKQLFGIDYDSFFNVIGCMIRLCYDKPHTVGIWEPFELSKKIKAKTNVRPSIIRKITKLLSTFPELVRMGCAAILLDNKILLDFHRLTLARLVLSEICIEEACLNDLKGPIFEEACRNLMRGKGLATLPKTVDITEPMLPERVSYKLWKRVKPMSDIDVVSCYDNRVIIIECKQIKPARKSKWLRKLKLKEFKKYPTEHFYKTKWIAENVGKFERYVGENLSDALSIDKSKTINFFPLVVTNKHVEIEEKEVPIITYRELEEIDFPRDLHKVDLKSPDSSVEMQALGRTVNVPRFATVELENSD